MIFDPSIRYLVRLPTISAGNTTSSSIASWTAVRVRLRGRWAAEPFFGGRTILLVAIRITSCKLKVHWYTTKWSINYITVWYHKLITMMRKSKLLVQYYFQRMRKSKLLSKN